MKNGDLADGQYKEKGEGDATKDMRDVRLYDFSVSFRA
jgi:hypothetical protein